MYIPATSPRRLFAAMLCGLLVLPVVAFATDPAPAKSATTTTYYADDPAKWGAPLAWQPPDYPKALLAQQISGKVDALVTVSPEGRMTEITAMRSAPAQPAFEEAVREAMRGWTFTKAMDAACKPVATQSRVQVRFEMVDGKPQVNVGAAPAANVPGRVFIEELNRTELRKALAENYPRDAVRMRKTGEVHALLHVDARSGVTQSVDIVDVMADNASYNPEPRMLPTSGMSRTPTRSSPASIQFASVAREELAAARFKPVLDAGEPVINVCRKVTFHMRGVKRN